jgi:predicted transcriptional regulator
MTSERRQRMAADLAGVSRKTIYSYMNADTEFIATYRDMKRG